MPPKKRPHPDSASTSASTSPASASDSVNLNLVMNHLECPVCFEVPRDGVMLQCVNGHNVCATCKGKMGEDGNCPQGDCRYNDPPTRNRAFGDLIRSLPLPCKHAKSNGANANAPDCDFVATKELLGPHEKVCQRRPVPCPWDECAESIAASEVVAHLATAHRVAQGGTDARACIFDDTFPWRPEFGDGGACHGWVGRPCATTKGIALPCAHLRGGLVYVWLVLLAPESKASKLRCFINFGRDFRSMRFDAPVYPVDRSRQKIMGDKNCARFTVWSIEKMLMKDITAEDTNEGRRYKFRAIFTILMK